jgi:hypothetical protein
VIAENNETDKYLGISCLKTAKIIVPETQSTYQCRIRKLSFLTVYLELEHYVPLPEEFLISLNNVDYAAPIRCKTLKRSGNNVNAKFV